MEMQAEPEKLKASAESLARAARAMDGELRQLALTSRELNGAWQGEGKRAFLSMYSTFQRDAAAQVDALGEVAAALGDLADEYSSVDAKVAATLPG